MTDHVDDARELRHRRQQEALVAALQYTGPVHCLHPECGLEILPRDERQPACRCNSPLGESLDLMISRLSREAAGSRRQVTTLSAELRAAQESNLALLERLAEAHAREADIADEMVRLRHALGAFTQQAGGLLDAALAAAQ